MYVIPPSVLFHSLSFHFDQYKLGDFGLVSKLDNHSDVEEGDSRYMSMELLSGDLDDLTKVREKICLFVYFYLYYEVESL